MSGGDEGAPSSRETHEFRPDVEQLIRRLGEVEGTIQSLAAGEIDAVLDPATSAPILLSQAQAAIARSEARYRDLVSRAPSIVCELTPEGETLFVNEAVRSILGYQPDDLRGRNWWDALVPAEDRDRAEEMLRKARGGDVTAYELRVTAANGGRRYIAWNTANRYSPEGGLESVILFGADVTARREAEENARRLSQERLARVEAEASNHAKTEFLAVMSHELRTPLNAIAGYVDLLELGIRGPLTPEQQEDLRRIRRSQKHLLMLIEDVLNFARVETGRVEFEIRPVSVLDALLTARAVTEPQARRKNLAFHMPDCDPELAVCADRERLHQILINLVTNGIKYTPSGGRVELLCEPSAEIVRLSVSDTGRGIPVDKLEAIFEPFVQLKDRHNERPDGVGLGLAISHSLARAMDGSLTVESEDGHGSTFVLELPRAPDGARRPAPSAIE